MTPPAEPQATRNADADDELVPVSVRLGHVVPPEDPEDWTAPLTWVAAAGMLAAPVVTLLWFWLVPPAEFHGGARLPGTILVAAAVALGGVLTGATQQGGLRASTATIAAGLFAGLASVIVGLLMAGERQTGVASPTVAQAFGASLAGLAGTIAAAPLAARFASTRRWLPRLLGPGAVALGGQLAGCRIALRRYAGGGPLGTGFGRWRPARRAVLDQQACSRVPAAQVEQRRVLQRASGEGDRAAWVEPAAGRDARRIGRLADAGSRVAGARTGRGPAPPSAAPGCRGAADRTARSGRRRSRRFGPGTSPRSGRRRRRRSTGRG